MVLNPGSSQPAVERRSPAFRRALSGFFIRLHQTVRRHGAAQGRLRRRLDKFHVIKLANKKIRKKFWPAVGTQFFSNPDGAFGPKWRSTDPPPFCFIEGFSKDDSPTSLSALSHGPAPWFPCRRRWPTKSPLLARRREPAAIVRRSCASPSGEGAAAKLLGDERCK